MRYRKLGRWGLKVSVVSVGGWTTFGGTVTEQDLIRRILVTAYDAGVNYFDTADVYAHGEAERRMGRALGELPRHTLVLSSKCYFPMSDDPNDRGLSRKHIHESVDASLTRLGSDYLDLYFAHRADDDVPLDEVVRAFSDLVTAGKVLYWGTSEWPADRVRQAVELAHAAGWHPPAVEQPQYSLLYRRHVEEEIAPLADELGIGLVVWSPLAQGMLTGKYDDGIGVRTRFAELPQFTRGYLVPGNLERVRQMRALGDEAGVTRAQLALAWVTDHPQVSSAITGATALEQLEENLGAADVELSGELRHRLDTLFAA